MAARSTFVWGMQRSGIHLIASWLYANNGGVRQDPLPKSGLHPQLRDGFSDLDAGVAFFNNPGRFHCRTFGMGNLSPESFEAATAWSGRAIFSIEDCELRHVDQLPSHEDTANVLLVRHPLNLVASRLRGANRSPGLFRTDDRFVKVLAAHCAEALGQTEQLPHRTVICFDRFVRDAPLRDSLATELGLPNHDDLDQVSTYGGGSSFTATEGRPSVEALGSRYLEHPIAPRLLDLLLAQPPIVEACRTLFDFELASVAKVS